MLRPSQGVGRMVSRQITNQCRTRRVSSCSVAEVWSLWRLSRWWFALPSLLGVIVVVYVGTVVVVVAAVVAVMHSGSGRRSHLRRCRCEGHWSL